MPLIPCRPDAAPPETLVETGSMVLKNITPKRLRHLGGTRLAAIDDEIGYEADLIDLSTGTATRLPRYDDYGVVDILAEENDAATLYLVVMKGHERPFQRLIKIDAGTLEALWTCALSKTLGGWSWTQDSEHLYYNDTKNLFSISKKTGQSSKKLPLPHQGDPRPFIPEGGRLLALHEGDLILCAWKPRTLALMLMRIDPRAGAAKWELELGRQEYAHAAASRGGIVYLLGSSGTLYMIDAATGKLAGQEILSDGYALGRGFFESGTELKAYVSADKYEHRFSIVTCDTRDGKATVEEAPFIPSQDQAVNLMKGTLLYWTQIDTVFVFDLAGKERLSLLTAKNRIADMWLLGDSLYLIHDEGRGGRLVQLGNAGARPASTTSCLVKTK